MKRDKGHHIEITDRKIKRDIEDANLIAHEQERKKSYIAKELAIQKASNLRITERAKKRSDEETEQIAKALARKKVYDDNEKKRDETLKARKLRNNT